VSESATVFQLLVESPLGPLLLTFSSRGLAGLKFPGENNQSQSPPSGNLSPRFHPAWISETIEALKSYFAKVPQDFRQLPLDLVSTPFQLQVWQELRDIPWGTTISYREMARRVGLPQGSRAVGQALAANPIPIIIPCHRVIAHDGSLGGYSSGPHRKRWLLQHEGVLK
jgi:methylated-DNA-[protein]-cysteine S-methyltransferase